MSGTTLSVLATGGGSCPFTRVKRSDIRTQIKQRAVGDVLQIRCALEAQPQSVTTFN
jgi:hypothetical protein